MKRPFKILFFCYMLLLFINYERDNYEIAIIIHVICPWTIFVNNIAVVSLLNIVLGNCSPVIISLCMNSWLRWMVMENVADNVWKKAMRAVKLPTREWAFHTGSNIWWAILQRIRVALLSALYDVNDARYTTFNITCGIRKFREWSMNNSGVWIWRLLLASFKCRFDKNPTTRSYHFFDKCIIDPSIYMMIRQSFSGWYFDDDCS